MRGNVVRNRAKQRVQICFDALTTRKATQREETLYNFGKSLRLEIEHDLRVSFQSALKNEQTS